MTTAQELINSSAKQAGILAEGQALEAGINSDALSRLNRLIDRWQNEGIDLGLSTLTATDTLFIDEADEEAIELALTLRLMVRHRRQIPAGLSEAAAEAKTELQAKYERVVEMDIPVGMTKNLANWKTD